MTVEAGAGMIHTAVLVTAIVCWLEDIEMNEKKETQ